MRRFYKRFTECLLFALIVVGGTAQAFIGVTGTIASLLIVGSGSGAPGNYDLRVFLSGNVVVCNGQPWAYINTTDANYNAITAAAMTAKATGGTVTLYVSQDGAGYCQLAYIMIN